MSEPFNCSICKHLTGNYCSKFKTAIVNPFNIHKPIDFCSYYKKKETSSGDIQEGAQGVLHGDEHETS